MIIPPEVVAALVTALGAFATLLGAIAVYLRAAAKALEERAATSKQTADDVAKVRKDTDEAHSRIRSLDGRVLRLERNTSQGRKDNGG